MILDLSVPTEASASEATPVEVSVLDYEKGPEAFGLRAGDFPGGMGISNETVTLTTHSGTHVDAPSHYGPFSMGSAAKTISEVPLEWCYGPGLRVDVRHRAPGEEITLDDVREALARDQLRMRPGDILLLWTGRDRLWGTQEYLTDYPGLGEEATRYIVESGVRMIGTDAWGLDRPARDMIEDFQNFGDASALWPAHLYGREQEYCQIEKLSNLDQLPGADGFLIACFPVKLRGLGAGWTRTVAIFERDADVRGG